MMKESHGASKLAALLPLFAGSALLVFYRQQPSNLLGPLTQRAALRQLRARGVMPNSPGEIFTQIGQQVRKDGLTAQVLCLGNDRQLPA